MNKKQRNAQREAEQHTGRVYNARNAAVPYTEDMRSKGIEVKTIFYDYENDKRLSPDHWRVKVADELFTMEEFHAMMILMGYIK